jgi:putative SOS response-associated peptidase YedK
MCNHYRADLKKLGLEMEVRGFEEFSETKIRMRLQDIRDDMFPDRAGLVGIRSDGGLITPASMRWGFPPLVDKATGKAKGPVITNVRNTSSGFWRPWLKPEYRCIVPATSFAEPYGKGKGDAWFERADGGLLAFAGIWRPWTGTRGTKADPVEGEHKLFSFLTTEPNAVVAPIHPKAMPVVLPPEDWEMWLTAPTEIALAMQRPAPDDFLRLTNPI